ncbi:zinc finger protein ZFP2-like [Culicoides brevitarsis]|uniref:zinc finger protein ZFP2-like n=1 Tax=Culicoides brevitarsis TaxID=469753 RepID=UPI00307C5B0A
MHFKLENAWNSSSGSGHNTNETNNYYVYPWHKASKHATASAGNTTAEINELDDDSDEEAAAIAILDDCDDLSLLVDEFDNYSPQTPPITSTPKRKRRINRRTVSTVSSNNASNASTTQVSNSNNCIKIKILSNKSGSENATTSGSPQQNTSGGRKSKDFRMKDELANPECLEKLKYENILYKHTEEKPWICKNCGRNYKWKNSLKCHLRNECGVEPKYHCTKMCGYKTHIYSNLKRHLRSKFCRPVDGGGSLSLVKKPGNSTTSPSLDEPCDLRLLTPSVNLRELSSSSVTSPITPPSNITSVPLPLFSGGSSSGAGSGSVSAAIASATANLLSSGLIPTTTTGGAYTCNRCGNSYARPHSLNRHIRFECGVEPKFQCPICILRAKHDNVTDEQMEPKIIMLTNGETRYSCSKCGVKYKKMSALRSHFKECGKGAQCPYCPKVVTQRHSAFSILQTLLNTGNALQNRDVPAQCPYCKRVYANSQKVQAHIKKYCLKEKKYKCMFCAYRSKRRDHIIRHAARVHETLVAEKVQEGLITGASDAFIDEGELDGDVSNAGGGVGGGTASESGESLLKPLLAVNKNNNVSGEDKDDDDGQQAIFDDDETAEESDHDSDYDEDAITDDN